jgi:hypothetical protein
MELVLLANRRDGLPFNEVEAQQPHFFLSREVTAVSRSIGVLIFGFHGG